MPFQTIFTCDDVQLSTNEGCVPLNGGIGSDNWSDIKVSVYNLGVDTSWLMVEDCESKEPSLPVIFRAMRSGWKIACDEDANIIAIQAEEGDKLTMGNQTLRFDNVADFWSFMYQIALSRLHDYAT